MSERKVLKEITFNRKVVLEEEDEMDVKQVIADVLGIYTFDVEFELEDE